MENWSKIETIFSLKLNITPNVLDELPFYRFEMILRSYEEIIEEEEKRHKQQEQQYEKEYKTNKYKPKTPKQPKVGNTNYGGFKTPKINMPKL